MMSKSGKLILTVCIVLAVSAAGTPKIDPLVDDFSLETVGAMPVSFVPAGGNWSIHGEYFKKDTLLLSIANCKIDNIASE